MFKHVIAVALAASLGACAFSDGPAPSISTADKVTLVYTPVRMLASLCAAGVSKPCQDPNVSANVKAALPIADAAVAEAIKQSAADPSRSNVVKWSGYAVSAITVLANVLAAYDVKG